MRGFPAGCDSIWGKKAAGFPHQPHCGIIKSGLFLSKRPHACGCLIRKGGGTMRRTERLEHYAVPARVLHAGSFHKNGCSAGLRERSAHFSPSGHPASFAFTGIAI